MVIRRRVDFSNPKMCKLITSATLAWNCLNGIVNVYKPSGITSNAVRNAILSNLCKELNQLEVRKPRKRVSIEPGGINNYVIKKITDLSDHPLAVGPRYQMKDIKCAHAVSLGIHSSGVLLLGINRGISYITKLHENRPIRAYHVKGSFGKATETHFNDSRITIKSTFRHISDARLSGLIASMQASHQRKMFELCGVDIQSQAAYELALSGVIRPVNNKIPVIYGIKLISFSNPDFTLEIHAINEDENYLATLINEIGIEMRSAAHCVGIRCIRHAHFSVEDSLLRRHWKLSTILGNMKNCKEILSQHIELIDRTNVALSQ